MPAKSLLQLLEECDNFPDKPPPGIFSFKCNDCHLGFVGRKVAAELRRLVDWHVIENRETNENSIEFAKHVDSVEKRSKVIATTAEGWRKSETFAVLSKWRDELYGVYAPSHHLCFTIERSASPLFGVATFGVHMTGFIPRPLRIWCPLRAAHKTHGGMRDNTVAGGIAHGMGMFDTLVKECGEEAGLDGEYVRSRAHAAGVISYHYIRGASAGGETGLFQPEYEFIYDLEMDENTVPKPCDGEVERFDLWTVEQVMKALQAGEFKPNCALVMIDFLVRHGVIHAGNEPDLVKILTHLHRDMPFPTI